MIGLIQRVKEASVSVNGEVYSSIHPGLLLLLGVEKGDSQQEIEKLSRKVLNYRIFADDEGKMNQSLLDVKGDLLVVSQFTLVAQTDKGNRPGFSKGAGPEEGNKVYLDFIAHLQQTNISLKTGCYGEDMQVALVNDGPATFYFKV